MVNIPVRFFVGKTRSHPPRLPPASRCIMTCLSPFSTHTAKFSTYWWLLGKYPVWSSVR